MSKFSNINYPYINLKYLRPGEVFTADLLLLIERDHQPESIQKDARFNEEEYYGRSMADAFINRMGDWTEDVALFASWHVLIKLEKDLNFPASTLLYLRTLPKLISNSNLENSKAVKYLVESSFLVPKNNCVFSMPKGLFSEINMGMPWWKQGNNKEIIKK